MNVTAALAFYDEPAEQLAALVRSLRGLCTRIVAVDGRYKLTPGKTHWSPPEQLRAISDAAVKARLRCEIHQPAEALIGQVAKRDWMMRRAAEGSDWVLIVDADYLIHCSRPQDVHRELQHTRADAIAIPFWTPIPPDENGVAYDLQANAPHAWHIALAGRTDPHHLLFRALPEIRVEQHHWWISAMKGRRRVALWGCGKMYPLARQAQINSHLVIEHRCFYRTKDTLERNRVYCERRAPLVAAGGFEP